MRISVKHIHIPKPVEEVFAYIADLDNFPKWAFHFCKELRREGDDVKVLTPMGEMYLEFRTDAATGVIDMAAGPCKDQMETFPTRVVGLPDGSSVYTTVCFQGLDGDEAAFEAMNQSTREELDALKAAF